MLEVQDHPHIRAAPSVNGLIGITHHHDAAAFSNQAIEQKVLRAVDVLIFIHLNPINPTALLLPHLIINGEDMQRHRQQIVKIKSTLFF